MSALQAALIGVVAALSVLEGGWLGECKLREPVVTGFLVGLILGNVKEGLIIGAQLELIWMGTASIGPTAGLSIGTGGTIGTAIALSTGSGIEVAMAFGGCFRYVVFAKQASAGMRPRKERSTQYGKHPKTGKQLSHRGLHGL